MRTARQGKNKKKPKPLLFRLTRRTVLLLFLFDAAMVLYYTVGNYQNFLDSTQLILIRTAVVSSTALMFISLAGALEAFVLGILRKGVRLYYFVHFVVMALLSISALVVQIVFKSIDILSEGL